MWERSVAAGREPAGGGGEGGIVEEPVFVELDEEAVEAADDGGIAAAALALEFEQATEADGVEGAGGCHSRWRAATPKAPGPV